MTGEKRAVSLAEYEAGAPPRPAAPPTAPPTTAPKPWSNGPPQRRTYTNGQAWAIGLGALVLAVLAAFALAFIVKATGPQPIHHKDAGFSITVPSDWSDTLPLPTVVSIDGLGAKDTLWDAKQGNSNKEGVIVASGPAPTDVRSASAQLDVVKQRVERLHDDNYVTRTSVDGKPAMIAEYTTVVHDGDAEAYTEWTFGVRVLVVVDQRHDRLLYVAGYSTESDQDGSVKRKILASFHTT